MVLSQDANTLTRYGTMFFHASEIPLMHDFQQNASPPPHEIPVRQYLEHSLQNRRIGESARIPWPAGPLTEPMPILYLGLFESWNTFRAFPKRS